MNDTGSADYEAAFEDEHDQHIARLKQALLDLHADLARHSPGSAGRSDAIDTMMAATQELLDYESGVRAARDAAVAAQLIQSRPRPSIDDVAAELIGAYLRWHGQRRCSVIAVDLCVPLPLLSRSLRRLERAGEAIQIRSDVWAHPDYDPAHDDTTTTVNGAHR